MLQALLLFALSSGTGYALFDHRNCKAPSLWKPNGWCLECPEDTILEFYYYVHRDTRATCVCVADGYEGFDDDDVVTECTVTQNGENRTFEEYLSSPEGLRAIPLYVSCDDYDVEGCWEEDYEEGDAWVAISKHV
jgi:hypothetical protein